MIEIEKKVLLNRVVFYIKGTNILHREDGPAVEAADGAKKWLINGKLHREDGPAVIFENGTVEWYLDGKGYEKEQWFEALNTEQKEKALYSKYFIAG